MRTRIEELSPEDKAEHLEVYLQAELARCGCLDAKPAKDALRAEMLFLRDLVLRYQLEDDEDFEVDPVYGAIYSAEG